MTALNSLILKDLQIAHH